MAYVDGYVVPVPEDRIEEYRTLARESGEIWMKHGALAYHECMADDVKPGEVTSFPQAVKLEDGETTILGWAVYQSREHRDEVMAKVMEDPYFKDCDPSSMPFDAKRMFWGGFKEIVSF